MQKQAYKKSQPQPQPQPKAQPQPLPKGQAVFASEEKKAGYMSLDVTEVRLTIMPQGSGNLICFASMTIQGLFVVGGIKVMNSVKGVFVSMPQRKNDKTGEYHDICFPISKEAREQVNEAILSQCRAEGLIS